MKEDEVLELKTRRKIYHSILKKPGLHKRELTRQLNIAYSTLDYHIFHLKKRNLIMTESDGRFVRYYATGKIGSEDKKIIAMLRQAVPRKIILYLILNPNTTHKTLRNHLGLAPSTTSFHLKKLADLNITNSQSVGKETAYSINEVDYVTDLLVTYRTAFLGTAVEQFINTLADLHPRYLRKSKKEKE